MTEPAIRRGRGESGVFIILWALLLVALLTMVAIVLDLSALRQDRRANRSAADAAATAGAFTLGSGTLLAACQEAWNYVARNLNFAPSGAGSSPCASGTPSAFTANPCTTTTTSEVTKTVGMRTITIKSPVPDDDPVFMRADSIGGDKTQSYSAPTDGSDPCKRLGVRIEFERQATFAKVIGVGSHTTNTHSVARFRPGEGQLSASFVLLEPTGCNGLQTQTGNSGIAVVIPTGLNGGIVTDSTGTGCASGSTLRSDGNRGVIVCNQGAVIGECASPATPLASPSGIYVNALNTSTCVSRVPAGCPYGGNNTISPTPVASPKAITRSPVDYRYNCKKNYAVTGLDPNYEDTKITVSPSSPILPACPDAPATGTEELDFINEFVRATNPVLFPATAAAPAGALNPPAPVVPVTDCTLEPWLVSRSRDINCVPPNNTVINGPAIFRQDIPNRLTVNGNAIFMASMASAGDFLIINGSAVFNQSFTTSRALTIGATGAYQSVTCAPSFAGFISNVSTCLRNPGSTANIVIARGDLLQTSSVIWNLTKTFVYAGGVVGQQGSGVINWTPPTEGPFANLALWTETTGESRLGGGGGILVRGTFFGPRGRFRLQGNPGMSPQGAQFLGLTLVTGGNALFKLEPNAALVTVPIGARSALIR